MSASVFRVMWLWCCLAVVGVSFATAATPLRNSDFVSIHGRLYVDAFRWAERQKLIPRWNNVSGDLRLTNRTVRLDFKADTARVELDGTLVWLSAPLAKQGGRPLLPVQDVDHVLNPLLNPPKLPAGDRIKVIALSAGHGGKDPGNMEGTRREKEYTLKLAFELEKQLERLGFKVIQIRDSDRYIAPEERPVIANEKKADLYLALHFNSRPSARGSAQGLETYCLTLPNAESTNGGQSRGRMPGNRQDSQNLNLAYQLHRTLRGELRMADRGVRRANFAELRLAEMPAVLIEGGFMDSVEDARKIYSDQARVKYATAIVNGVLAYKRLVERPEPQ